MKWIPLTTDNPPPPYTIIAFEVEESDTWIGIGWFSPSNDDSNLLGTFKFQLTSMENEGGFIKLMEAYKTVPCGLHWYSADNCAVKRWLPLMDYLKKI